MPSKKNGPSQKGRASKKAPASDEQKTGKEAAGSSAVEQGGSGEERLEELRQTGEAIGKLAQNPDAFERAVNAFRAQDAERFQAELAKLDLLRFCVLICRWLCSKHCVFICFRLCRGPVKVDTDQLPVAEMREFALATAQLARQDALLRRFLDAVDREDAAAFNRLLVEMKWERFCHQLCHYLCVVRCRLVCRLMCPPPPLITEVGYIPTSQIDPTGRASGPSLPPGTTPPDNKPAGVGDHPFGGLENIRGVFNVANPFQYKVEFGPAPGGPWTPITQPITDIYPDPLFPLPGHPSPITTHPRLPLAGGWYNVSEMGLLGPDYLTDWPTPPDRDKLYYLKLTVRNAALTEFQSPVTPARVDNGSPNPAPRPIIDLQLQTPDGQRRTLGCCEKVERGKGNLVVITITAWDENFSSINVALLGGCGWSFPIVDTGGTSLSKTYNGNIADTGYPVATEFLWDPWAAKIDPCCYLIDVRINDRAIINNSWSGGHPNENWRSITIA
ncbi:MAG: hypothetical protein DMF67_07810 [Acidobacteria bacterium]|nr:MAG: hypothetical protein DMF67_07810 [Acidobacteriota bacterium]